MSIYIPYTYYIYHRPTGKHYYGVRYANNKKDIANPNDLWVKYFTSSKKVKALIEQYGKDSFDVYVRKIFNNRDDAVAWEHKVLRRLKINIRKDWINLAYFSVPSKFNYKLTEEHKQRIRDKAVGNKHTLGLIHTEESKRKMSEKKKGRIVSDLAKEKIAIARSLTYIITLPCGEDVMVVNLNKFCKNNGLDTSSMCRIAKGKLKQHKGYKCRYV